MTMKDALDGGMGLDEISNPGGMAEAEEPRELKEAHVRHLAYGASESTMCGLDRAAVSTVHPSKARRTDCQACRDKFRGMTAGKPKKTSDATVDAATEEGRPEKFGAGDHVEFPADGSVWHVDDARVSGVDMTCVLGGSSYKRGAKTTVSAGAAVRVFKPGEWDKLVAESRARASAAKISAGVLGEPPAAPAANPAAPREPAAGKWAPTQAEVDEVLKLKREGKKFREIEQLMGWPDGNGNRPWRIFHGKVLARAADAV